VDAGLLALLAVVAVRNAFEYHWLLGYDASEHLTYARELLATGSIPDTGASYTPPGFYALAAGALRAGEWLGMAEPERLVQLGNGLLAVATAVLMLVLAHLLFPGRALLRWAALGFLIACPIVLKTAAMFHPQTLAMFVATLALTLAAWMIVRRRYAWWAWVLLALVLGLGQLVRSVSVFTFVVVVATFAVVLVVQREHRRPVGRALAVVAAAAVLIPLPWYIHLQASTSSPILGRPVSGSLWDNRPLAFYVSPGLPDVITHPQRNILPPRFLPVVYAETWGDYFGIWAWGPPRPELTEAVNRRLTLQSVVGIPFTLLGIAGWLALLALSIARLRDHPERLLVALMPLVTILGTLYFAVRNPSPDGDTIKGLFMLTAVPAWALSFGFAIDCLAGQWPRTVLALSLVLVVCGVVSVNFAWA
jgi:hypothetical protein